MSYKFGLVNHSSLNKVSGGYWGFPNQKGFLRYRCGENSVGEQQNQKIKGLQVLRNPLVFLG